MVAADILPEAAVTNTDFQTRLAALRDHVAETPRQMRAAFAADPARFAALSVSDGDLLIDFSKCAVTERTLALLEELALAAGLPERRDAMFSGQKINVTENRRPRPGHGRSGAGAVA